MYILVSRIREGIQNFIIRNFYMRNKLASKEKLVIVIRVSIIAFINSGLFQPQREHFIDALQNPNSYDKYKPKVNIEKSSDTTTAELF